MDPAAQGTILADALLIDRVVKRFEEAWRNGEQPQVEGFLESLPATHRSIAHERLHAAAHRLKVEENKRDLENESLAITYLHDTSEQDTKGGAADATPAEMPKQLGAFQLQAELGRGAFGVVYQAYDSRLDRQVAIKVPLLDSEKSRQQYIDEARKAAMIESVGIVPVYHVDTTEGGSPYVVQKFIDGPNLRSLLQRVGGIGLRPALTIVRDVARSLALAHRSGMIHRDLKPENILLDKEGIPWIADFGLALREDEQDGRAGEVAGTPLYMSPEQVRGKTDWLDGRTDIWAAGVLLYELIAGRPPFAAKNIERLIREICRRDPKPLSQRSADTPAELDEIFSRCCAKRARDRYASADELAQQLDLVLQALFPGESSLADTPGWSSAAGSTEPSEGSELALPARLSGGQRSAVGAASPQPPLRQTKRNSTVQAVSPQASSGAQPIAVSPSRRTTRWGLWMSAAVLVAAGLGTGAYSMWGRSFSGSGNQEVPTDVVVDPPHDPPPWPYELTVMPPDGPVPANELYVEVPPDFSHLVVSPDGQKPDTQRNAYRTIAEALEDVESGGEIEIRPGFYNESLTIDKPVVLTGAASRSQVVIQSIAGPCLTIEGGTLAAHRITFRGQGTQGQHEFNTIDLIDGALQLSECEVSAATFCCVKARKATQLTAAHCEFVALTDSALSCVESQPVSLTGCTFRDCSKGAAIELIGCSGTVVDCKLLGNNLYGVYCKDTGDTPVSVRNCKWEGCQQAGIQSLEGGSVDVQGGTLARCKVSVEARSGKVWLRDLVVLDGTNPCMSVTQQGQLEAEGCEFRSCLVGLAMEDAQVKLTDCQILAMAYMGVYTKAGSQLQMTNCRVERCQESGMKLVDTRLTISGGSVSHNGAGGIYASGSRGSVTAKDLTIEANSKIGFHLTDGTADFTAGTISKHEFGVLVDRSQGAAKATQFDAQNLLLDGNTSVAFQFLEGTEGDLKACRTINHPPNKALVVSVEASVLTDDDCKFEQ